jgi:hypothetical protein
MHAIQRFHQVYANVSIRKIYATSQTRWWIFGTGYRNYLYYFELQTDKTSLKIFLGSFYILYLAS